MLQIFHSFPLSADLVLTGYNLLDIHFVALLQPGLPAAAVRAGLSVLKGGIGAFAGVAPGDGGDGFIEELGMLYERRFLGIPVPAIHQILRLNAGNLTEFQGDGFNIRQLVLFGDLLHLFNDIGNDTQFVHDGPFP